MPTTNDPNIITLKNVRLSYPQLWEAKAAEAGGKPKYSATFLLDAEEHAKTIALLEKAIERVALDKFKKKVPLRHKCLRDGNDKPDTEGYGDGTMFVPASSLDRPVTVGKNPAIPVTKDDAVLYAGCTVNAVIRLFAYEHATGGKGVSAGLQAVQFVKDGPSFGAGRVNATEVFDDLEGDVNDL